MKDKIIIIIMVIILLVLTGRLCLKKYDKINVISNIAQQTEEKKVAYLTFDDGPSMVTQDILDTLREKDVKATFFLIASNINEETEAIVKQAIEDGHTIGVHSYCHEQNIIYRSADAFIEDFDKAYEIIKETTGQDPRVYRFPWGSSNCYLNGIRKDIIEKLDKRGLTYYDWNVTAEDSVGRPTGYSIIKNIKKDYIKYNQPVILMHDSKSNQLTADKLPEIIDMMRENGYDFDTVEHRYRAYQYNIK